MDINQIATLTEALDGMIPKEDAKIKVIFDRHNNFNQLIGTNTGLLRFGVELLRAGLALQKKDSAPFFANKRAKAPLPQPISKIRMPLEADVHCKIIGKRKVR